ncbi:hypothetical protein P879_05250 [Paragonimus westermani]|uniref:Uncharacterized protein n=1 Tax=Paragonimus westermani TaxID=34504 RepID=A0A8T0DTX1_9TREM|nr:hypothetical protein P879_05250 [Paragonimus westermani]
MVQSACDKPIFHSPDPNDYALTSPHDTVSEAVLTSHPRHKQSSYGACGNGGLIGDLCTIVRSVRREQIRFYSVIKY